MAICETWEGWEIVFERYGHSFPVYVKDVRQGKITWTTDYLYAKHYSRGTATLHNKRIKGMEYKGADVIDLEKTAKEWSHCTV